MVWLGDDVYLYSFCVVVIKGGLARQVSSAITRVEVITESGRSKLQFSHFLSIPVHHTTIQQRFSAFKQQVLTEFSEVRKSLDIPLTVRHLNCCTRTVS